MLITGQISNGSIELLLSDLLFDDLLHYFIQVGSNTNGSEILHRVTYVIKFFRFVQENYSRSREELWNFFIS